MPDESTAFLRKEKLMQFDNLKVIGFDADDTLWVNEPYYRETEDRFCSLLGKFAGKETVVQNLLEVEI